LLLPFERFGFAFLSKYSQGCPFVGLDTAILVVFVFKFFLFIPMETGFRNYSKQSGISQTWVPVGPTYDNLVISTQTEEKLLWAAAAPFLRQAQPAVRHLVVGYG